MNTKMNIAGAAPFIAVPTFVYLIITAIISLNEKPFYTITEEHYGILIVLGIVLILLGILMVVNCARKLHKSFNQGLLMKDGLYKVFRNPMYAAYLLFIIPGIGLLFNSWLMLTTVLLNYILLTIFIQREYRYLHEKFGSEYQSYLEKVSIKFL
ncbi:MAG: isoprenylcysteine carboxylmethyltransferase family protein [Ignavibacterium sp.]|nr:isoprenylcysteine carboxylmethyltransferase family protein [Ignavibacterium sp.]